MADYDYPPTLELLYNWDHGPEYDPVVCANEVRLDGRYHRCYREPGHYGDHCCGEFHSNSPSANSCRCLWKNKNEPPLPEVVDFERQV
jgi:hypothetical protein